MIKQYQFLLIWLKRVREAEKEKRADFEQRELLWEQKAGELERILSQLHILGNVEKTKQENIYRQKIRESREAGRIQFAFPEADILDDASTDAIRSTDQGFTSMSLVKLTTDTTKYRELVEELYQKTQNKSVKVQALLVLILIYEYMMQNAPVQQVEMPMRKIEKFVEELVALDEGEWSAPGATPWETSWDEQHRHDIYFSQLAVCWYRCYERMLAVKDKKELVEEAFFKMYAAAGKCSQPAEWVEQYLEKDADVPAVFAEDYYMRRGMEKNRPVNDPLTELNRYLNRVRKTKDYFVYPSRTEFLNKIMNAAIRDMVDFEPFRERVLELEGYLHIRGTMAKRFDEWVKRKEDRILEVRKAEEERIAVERKAEEERIAAEKKAEAERLAAVKRAEEERIRMAAAVEKARLEAEEKERQRKLEEERKRVEAERQRIEAERKAEEERLERERREAEEKARQERLQREERIKEQLKERMRQYAHSGEHQQYLKEENRICPLEKYAEHMGYYLYTKLAKTAGVEGECEEALQALLEKDFDELGLPALIKEYETEVSSNFEKMRLETLEEWEYKEYMSCMPGFVTEQLARRGIRPKEKGLRPEEVDALFEKCLKGVHMRKIIRAKAAEREAMVIFGQEDKEYYFSEIQKRVADELQALRAMEEAKEAAAKLEEQKQQQEKERQRLAEKKAREYIEESQKKERERQKAEAAQSKRVAVEEKKRQRLEAKRVKAETALARREEVSLARGEQAALARGEQQRPARTERSFEEMIAAADAEAKRGALLYEVPVYTFIWVAFALCNSHFMSYEIQSFQELLEATVFQFVPTFLGGFIGMIRMKASYQRIGVSRVYYILHIIVQMVLSVLLVFAVASFCDFYEPVFMNLIFAVIHCAVYVLGVKLSDTCNGLVLREDEN